jgi:hypothetical protein
MSLKKMVETNRNKLHTSSEAWNRLHNVFNQDATANLGVMRAVPQRSRKMEASYVAESMSNMSATDGEETPDRYGSMLLRQICLEGLDIVVFGAQR